MEYLSAGRSLWNQRQRLAARSERVRALSTAVGRHSDLAPWQLVELLGFALEFRPDLILELGRERGNSTCCFLEAAELLQPEQPCRLISLCLTDLWQKETRPRLEPFCSSEWFARGEVLVRDLLTYDFAAALQTSKRCLIFWDAHGFDIAECVLGHVLPLLGNRKSAILLHDMSDLRYDGETAPAYGPEGLWKGGRDSEGTFWLGHICSHVAQAVSVVDFTSRNRIPLRSAGEEIHAEFAGQPDKVGEMRRLLGNDLFNLSAHWFWFTPQEAERPPVYPRWQKPMPPATHLRRMVRACRQFGGVVKRAMFSGAPEGRACGN